MTSLSTCRRCHVGNRNKNATADADIIISAQTSTSSTPGGLRRRQLLCHNSSSIVSLPHFIEQRIERRRQLSAATNRRLDEAAPHDVSGRSSGARGAASSQGPSPLLNPRGTTANLNSTAAASTRETSSFVHPVAFVMAKARLVAKQHPIPEDNDDDAADYSDDNDGVQDEDGHRIPTGSPSAHGTAARPKPTASRPHGGSAADKYNDVPISDTEQKALWLQSGETRSLLTFAVGASRWEKRAEATWH